MIFKNQDEKLKKKATLSENDVFWDISDITPPKKSEPRSHFYTSNETALIITGDSKEQSRTESIPKREAYTSELLSTFIPERSLLKEVNVFSWHSKYTFYERFCLDAHRYFNTVCDECEYVKYFSYMPSYIQMSNRQKKWYFYWRSRARQGEYLPTDSSYVMLFIYEIINLPDLIPAQEGIELLCEIWKNYRKSYTKLDKYMSEWVCDYCLVNGVKLPYEKICDFIYDAVDMCALKQFYIPLDEDLDAYSVLLFVRMSTYKWWKSKYITDENRGLFEKHVRKGFSYAIKRLSESDGRFDGSQNGRLEEKRAVRDSFSGALCAYQIKRRIDVSYVDLGNVGGIGFIVNDLVRYCENRVRAHLGIRAKLTVQNLTEQQKGIVDEYFDANLPSRIYEKRRKITDEYDVITEERHEFSVDFEKARAIEKASWQTTDRLTEELFDGIDLDEEAEETIIEPEEKLPEKEVSIESMTLDIAKTALEYIAKGDSDALHRLAEESYMMVETLVECVNELCFELLGDVGVEESDGRYELISDYEQEIRQWLKL